MKTHAFQWLTEQTLQNRDLVMIVDRQAEPDPTVELFDTDPMLDYINLYQTTLVAELAEIGPWLVAFPVAQSPSLVTWLKQPERNWGWLASVGQLDLQRLAQHWRERLLLEEDGQRSLYRFQDNRVISRHLQALKPSHWPELLGPIASALVWDGQAWQTFDNPAPGLYPIPATVPWQHVPEPQAVTQAIQRHNAELWLWQTHAAELCRLVERTDFAAWLDKHLAQANAWGWQTNESVQFLLSHQLRPELTEHPAWQPLASETAEAHLARCQKTFNAHTRRMGA
jgi:hypothetical protein